MRKARLIEWRVFGCATAIAAFVFSPAFARADETRECAAAFEQTQRAQQKNELLSALDAAERCARPSCPALLRDECATWSGDLRGKVPRLVVRVRSTNGCMRTDARVEVSGGSRRVDGEILVDPGVHEINVIDPTSSKSKSQHINFAAGERRDIDVDFAGPSAVCREVDKPKSSGGFHFSPLTLTLGAVGGGLMLAGATVGLIGASKRGDLDACKPACTREQIDEVRPFFLAGDVLGGFGVLALAAAVVTYLQTDARAPAPGSTSLIIEPTGVRGTFF